MNDLTIIFLLVVFNSFLGTLDYGIEFLFDCMFHVNLLSCVQLLGFTSSPVPLEFKEQEHEPFGVWCHVPV